ncbi:MAG: phosphodiesterase [Coriobacteriales bacterium]|nr:phosphodiesterase [Coriobacteriales bacterium]
MKLLIASDIHGAADACKRLMAAMDKHQPDRLVLLGDLLYHGPRNDLPADYDPKSVIALLNAHAQNIIAVRGNCEAEVDQMVLDFPCMATYNQLLDPATGHTLFFTHGHVYGPGLHNSVHNLPVLAPGDAMVYGHTHIKVNQLSDELEGVRYFNPGSVGIPKDGTASFGIYHDGRFEHCEL